MRRNRREEKNKVDAEETDKNSMRKLRRKSEEKEEDEEENRTAKEKEISNGVVFNTLKESGLKFCRKIKCHCSTEHHKQ